MNYRTALAFYLAAIRPQRKLLTIGLAFTVVESLMLTPIPKVIGYLVDRVAQADFTWFEFNLSSRNMEVNPVIPRRSDF